MPSRRVSAQLNEGTYFVTLTVERWYYLFDRFDRWQILADSIRYCQEHKAPQTSGHIPRRDSYLDQSGLKFDSQRFNHTKGNHRHFAHPEKRGTLMLPKNRNQPHEL